MPEHVDPLRGPLTSSVRSCLRATGARVCCSSCPRGPGDDRLCLCRARDRGPGCRVDAFEARGQDRSHRCDADGLSGDLLQRCPPCSVSRASNAFSVRSMAARQPCGSMNASSPFPPADAFAFSSPLNADACAERNTSHVSPFCTRKLLRKSLTICGYRGCPPASPRR